MKLSVFINQSFYFNDGIISTDLSFIKYIESFFDYFNEIIILAPSINNSMITGHYECSKRLNVLALPYYKDVIDLVKRAYKILPATNQLLNQELKNSDLLWIVGPHPLGWLAGKVAIQTECNAFYHIRGNILNDVKVRFKGWKYILASFYSAYMHRVSMYLCKRFPALVVGEELYDIYRKGVKHIDRMSPSLISSGLIRDTNVIIHNNILTNHIAPATVNLIFVGRQEPEKGLLVLFEALRILNNGGSNNYQLTIVGEAQRGSKKKEDELRSISSKISAEKYITWKGYIPYGDYLIKLYREADIFVLPSLAEGIPKVLYEAMATGLPIVSTNVGGIPNIIEHKKNGLLVKPNSPSAIVKAIQQITNDPGLKKRLVKNAFEKSKEHTIEKSRDDVMTKIRAKGLLSC